MIVTKKGFTSLKIVGGAIFIGLIIASLYGAFSIHKAKANLSRIQGPVGCSTQGTSATVLATTSVVYMTAGAATTTATCNMQTAGLGTEVFDTALLEVQFSGSSTASTINIDIQDSNGGVDYYNRSLAWNVENTGAASSSPSLASIQSYTFTFASSTQNRSLVTSATGATTTRSILVPVPNTFIRAIITMPAGSTPGAVWARWVGKTQVNN